MQDKHSQYKNDIIQKHQKEIQNLEKTHLDKITQMHKKFEHELEKVCFYYFLKKKTLKNLKQRSI